MDFNKLDLDLKIIPTTESKKIEGINFSGISYIGIKIDGVDILDKDLYYGSFIYFEELKKSILESGDYLLFTSVSGIADDAGWDLISVNHVDDRVTWNFERDDVQITFNFEKENYIEEIRNIEKRLTEVDKDINLEPVYVTYPEDFE